MKKIILLLALVAISHSIIFSQGCLPEGINFETQEQIDNFQNNYPGCTEIEGNVSIAGTDISNLIGLNVLTSIGGNLIITTNDLLPNLNGLENIISVGSDLNIVNNSLLLDIDALHHLSLIPGNLSIGFNPVLSNLNGFDSLSTIGGTLWITGNTNLYFLTGLHNLSSVNGYIMIWSSNVINLSGFESLTNSNAIVLENNFNLIDLNGFNNLSTINGEFVLNWNPLLNNLAGLENLTLIAGFLDITGNSSLKDITGLNNLTSLGGYLKIIENDSLISLSGIENIDYNSITDLYIINNPHLKECDIKSVCDYLAHPDGTRDIHDNDVGCNNQEQILELCPNSIEDNYLTTGIQIFPNPATSFITINVNGGQPIEEAIIYNHLGQKALEAVPVNNTVDVSTLKPGMYFVEVVTKDWRGRTKLIKQ